MKVGINLKFHVLGSHRNQKKQPEMQFWGHVIGAWNRYVFHDPETARFQKPSGSERVKWSRDRSKKISEMVILSRIKVF